jgi:4-hydroxy-tetrahydrodipicolinate reductase
MKQTSDTLSIGIAVAGCTGRIGRLLVDELSSGGWEPAVTLAGGTVREGSDYPANFPIATNLEELLSRTDVVIDFTRPEATVKAVQLAAQAGVPCVIGTTGLDAAQEEKLREAARSIPIIYAANMSVGVTLLSALVEQAAARLAAEWDIEILETHHKQKVDAPSGTALMLGRAAAKGRGEERFVMDHTGKREAGTIGYAVRRGGDVVGEHAVTFYGMGERLELSHMATDRRLFARGAIRAALWVINQPPGLYSMRDVLGL